MESDKVQLRVDAARARGNLTPAQEAIADGVYVFVDSARKAALREDPIPGRLANWWRGTLVEAAYRNLHTANAQVVDLFDADELRAEIPFAVTRANATLPKDDPRRATVAELEVEPVGELRPRLRRIIGDAYARLDLQHAQLRSFRNILVLAAAFLVVIVGITMYYVYRNPEIMPLCFPNEVPRGSITTTEQGLNCPTSAVTTTPAGGDILVVAVLGALGGALAATLSIRNLKGTSTPYDVPVALAFLKVPLGALTAILGLVAIQGKFVPGLSVLDSQGQILAYALVFGFGQQAVSRLLDQRAQHLLEGLPNGAEADAAEQGITRRKPVEPGPGGPPPEPAETEQTTMEDTMGAEEDLGPEATGEGTGPGEDVGQAAPAPTEPRPVIEPEDAGQDDQLELLRDSGNERRDMTADEESALLEEEFGPPDENGVFGAAQESESGKEEG